MLRNGFYRRLLLLVLIVVGDRTIKHILVHVCHVAVLELVLVLLGALLRLLLRVVRVRWLTVGAFILIR